MVVVRFLIPHEIKIELEIWPVKFLLGHGVTRSRIILGGTLEVFYLSISLGGRRL